MLRYILTPLVGVMVAVIGVAAALPSAQPVRADYQCYSNVCGETWRNNYTSQQCDAVSYTGCYQGTWSATYRSTPSKLSIEEHREVYLWCGPGVACWSLSTRYYNSTSNVTTLSTGGANYHSFKQHRTWAYHTEFSSGCACGGNTQDGY